MDTQKITVESTINAPVEKVWACYTEPAHITGWAYADASWHAPHAENDLRVDGRFLTRMEAKDGTAGFDFAGVYTEVVEHQKIAYTMDGDGRTTEVTFIPEGDSTRVITTFDPEHENPAEMQRAGWQSILDNFAAHVESH